MQTISQLKTLVAAAANHIEVQQDHHADAVEHYAGLIATGDDDSLEDAEAAVAHFAGLLSRAKARHAALVKQLAEAEANAKRETGEAAKARADALLADIQKRINSAMESAADLVTVADETSKMLEECNELRRVANINGVRSATGDVITVPQHEQVISAIQRMRALSAYLWRPLYM